ncbi:30S ribosomal protein S18 [Candidatus Daviesbacteria bacterium]|nr:30S ribosomal protein S18 [Candidatus Daviesbacteria bacterium]
MVQKKITRKIISSKLPPKKEEAPKQVEDLSTDEENSPGGRTVHAPSVQQNDGNKFASNEVRAKKVCYFCQSKTNPSYTDLANLRRYLTDRAKILPRARSGVCSKHQRAVARNIKYARHLALLPFVPKV